ncbi:MAG: cytochrome c oxidase subunit II [Flavobacteriales bacterium]|nr:cytochrome c oxidase subunit II [Flavobacteriales bacterium]
MTNILIILVVFLLLAALVQVIRVNELLSELKNQDLNKVTDKDNKIQATLFFLIAGVAYLALVLWQFKNWGPFLLPPASSVHGAAIDSLMNFTMGLIIFVFFITQPILVWFVYKYRKTKTKSAYYYPHNNNLEKIWTIVPTIVLSAVIFYGMSVWSQITNADTSESTVIEVYAKQFNWIARYSGDDNTLGAANFRLVGGKNTLGVDMEDIKAADDKITREVHLVVDKPVLLRFRSQDVIHSAYLPHFRVQMNCVPGMTTQFAFTPTQTTAQMKQQEGEDFEFILLCNKICGVAHYNMQMKFVVETQEEYDTWLTGKKTLSEKLLTQK